MSERVDQFTNELRDRLNTAEARLAALKADIQALPGKGEEALHKAHDQIQGKLQADKDRIDKTRASLRSRADQKMAETKEAIREWKARREVQKLNARADWAAAYAMDAVDAALASLDEAEGAIMEAVVARMDADAAAS